MKNAMRLIMAGMLCMMLAAQEPEKGRKGSHS